MRSFSLLFNEECQKLYENLFNVFGDDTPEQIEKGQISLKRKCMGQDKTMAQIIGWIRNEGNFT